MRSGIIAEILYTGRENVQTGKSLCALLNLKMRELTQEIEQERRDGQPICASTGGNPGYFLAANKGEMQRYCKSLLRRAGEIHKTRKACIETIDSLPEGGAEDEQEE